VNGQEIKTLFACVVKGHQWWSRLAIFIIDDVVGIYDTLRDDPISLGGIVFDWSD
jgi:hypothetical protein